MHYYDDVTVWSDQSGLELGISPCVASLSSTHLTLVAKLFAAPPPCTLLRAFDISNLTTSHCHYSIPSLAQDVHISTRRFNANGTCALFATSTMSAFESAIDDSFDPAPQLVRDTEGQDDDLFDNAYQGPREGHWEVTSSIGSFIDDRCPTTYDYGHRSRTNGRGALIDGHCACERQNTRTRDESQGQTIFHATRSEITEVFLRASLAQSVVQPRNARCSRRCE
jgi:hypothetical protein